MLEHAVEVADAQNLGTGASYTAWLERQHTARLDRIAARIAKAKAAREIAKLDAGSEHQEKRRRGIRLMGEAGGALGSQLLGFLDDEARMRKEREDAERFDIGGESRLLKDISKKAMAMKALEAMGAQTKARVKFSKGLLRAHVPASPKVRMGGKASGGS